ncbi:glycosyltransferase family 2 protein [Bizionia sp. KMM 8389]
MSLSIISPHYNDFDGLKQVYACLQKQTRSTWNWVIVDDKSDLKTQQEVQKWVDSLSNSKVQLFLNTKKTNASVCRNIGADLAKTDTLIFLDTDDAIAPHFIANREVDFTHFAIFINYAIQDENGNETKKKHIQGNYLNHFLAAKFLWQTTCILWNRDFFKKIGGFHIELPRLQDVELSIRALQQSESYSVIDNSIDFYYKTKPIRERKNFVIPVCAAVRIFISKLLQTESLNKHQLSLVSGYYFLCIRYLERSGSKENINLVQQNIDMFYEKKHINFNSYVLGLLVLKLYEHKIVSGSLFLRVNRYLFKPKQI